MDRRYEKSRRAWLSPSGGSLSLALSLPIGLACDAYQCRRVSLEGYFGVMERISKKARPFVLGRVTVFAPKPRSAEAVDLVYPVIASFEQADTG
ncbi:MAG: hypothetical protein V3S20_09695, partial [Dehalococcoidia bacterium]